MSIHKIRLAGGKSVFKAVVWLGERRQLTKRFEAKHDAEVWEREQRVRLRTPTKEVAPEIAAMTVGQLAGKWIESYAKLHLQESTRYKYATIFRRSIEPAFGRSKVADLLAPDHLAGKTEFLAGLATRAEATVIRLRRS